MVWIPFWAAGVINGLGHYWGYRNYPVEDASTNLFPIGILIGGEEFHNNHHAHPTSAKLSSAWYEFDIGWMYIRLLETLGLARVTRIAPLPRFSPSKTECDADTLRAVITHRYYVLAQYTRSVRNTCRQEIAGSSGAPPGAAKRRSMRAPRPSCCVGCVCIPGTEERADRCRSTGTAQGTPAADRLFDATGAERALERVRRSRSADQLLEQLRDWRARAESSGVAALREFARRLPHLI
jgi:stearoyl-CoA desaturase (delta-9 desaturase)